MTNQQESLSRAYARLRCLSAHLCTSGRYNPGWDDKLPCDGQDKPVILIGGMVLDTIACPSTELLPGTSIPGQIKQQPGGVARNIADALSRLVQPSQVQLISMVGRDTAGDALMSHWERTGCPSNGIFRSTNGRTPAVTALLDEFGDLAACVADTTALESDFTLEWVTQCIERCTEPAVLLLDANLNTDVLRSTADLCASSGIPVFFEPVSVAKSLRCVSFTQHITYLKPNAAELSALATALRKIPHTVQVPRSATTSIPCNDTHIVGADTARSDVPEIVKSAVLLLPDIATVLASGIKFIILSMGPLGCVICCLSHPTPASLHQNKFDVAGGTSTMIRLTCIPALECTLVNVTGAGDCLVGGTLFGLHEKRCIVDAVACGMAAARAACESMLNVPDELCRSSVLRYADIALERVAIVDTFSPSSI